MFVWLALFGCSSLEPLPNVRGPEGTVDTADPGADDPSGDDPTNEDDPTGDDPTDDPVDDPVDECPAGVICLDRFPATDSGTTTGLASNLDGYSCAPGTNESGPEQVYRLDIAEAGFLALNLTGLGNGVDVDVHLLDAQSASDCIDRGHWTSGSWVTPGTYWAVVDSWVGSDGTVYDGSYTLEVGHTTAADLESLGLQSQLAEDALIAFDNAWSWGDTERLEYGVIDFSMHSYEPRLFVFDLATEDLLFNEFITHGINSNHPTDPSLAVSFSNTNESLQSSRGMARVAETYSGSYGYSVRLDGLENGYNSNMRMRAIVMHPADYATEDFVDNYGYLGRSWGCPAMDPGVSSDVIDTLHDGALLFSWYPDSGYRSGSAYLR